MQRYGSIIIDAGHLSISISIEILSDHCACFNDLSRVLYVARGRWVMRHREWRLRQRNGAREHVGSTANFIRAGHGGSSDLTHANPALSIARSDDGRNDMVA
jgi:hypothetical protein